MNTVFHGISSISILKAKIWNLVRRNIKNIEKINIVTINWEKHLERTNMDTINWEKLLDRSVDYKQCNIQWLVSFNKWKPKKKNDYVVSAELILKMSVCIEKRSLIIFFIIPLFWYLNFLCLWKSTQKMRHSDCTFSNFFKFGAYSRKFGTQYYSFRIIHFLVFQHFFILYILCCTSFYGGNWC